MRPPLPRGYAGAMATMLEPLGGGLMIAGLGMMGAALAAAIGAWRHGLPWWSGSLAWLMIGRQAPAAQPFMRAARKRFLCGVVLIAASVAVLNISDALRPDPPAGQLD